MEKSENFITLTEEEFANCCALKIFYNAMSGVRLSSLTVNRPGLMLAGYKKDFAERRVQVMGRPEIGFLQQNTEYLDSFFQCDIPCVVISRGIKPTEEIIEAAKKYKKSVFVSSKKTSQVTEDISNCLIDLLGPTETAHGVLLDIYGTGVLLTGKSSIGKSETALELVYRGHRLVADDSVILKRINDTVVGTSPKIIKHFMEIRGVGIIDIKAIYGEGSIIDNKAVGLVIELEKWDDEKSYERVGNVQKYTHILGVKIPKLLIPVNAGRNVAVVVEVATRDYRLKISGHRASQIVNKRMEEDK
ncbi:MAG: HPr(Ser) kinase/phosphatase [Clostridia bacterium]|nr:HPr(Ser) kinase/phosphatase [Clostridia bacterium]